MKTETNVRQAVPFFAVSNMDASLLFYVGGLGFVMTNKWEPDGKIRWCWLELGGAAIMLQEFRDGRTAGDGISVCFICRDAVAIYHELKSRGVEASTPVVGNGMWVTSVKDPDGYRLEFESVTDVAEETVYDAMSSRAWGGGGGGGGRDRRAHQPGPSTPLGMTPSPCESSSSSS